MTEKSKKRVIPFNWMPGAWGLKGDTRKRAEIEYNYTGYEREEQLLMLDFQGDDLAVKLLDLDRFHGKISERQYAYAMLDYIEDETDKELARLDLDRIHNGLSDNDYEKAVATAKGEPWVTILSTSVDANDPAKGALELDWNEEFVTLLGLKGYTGANDNETVDLWFSTLCKNVAMEEFGGDGTVAEDMESGYAIKRQQAGEGKWEAK